MEKNKSGIVKKFFHCFHDFDDESLCGVVKWQGKVLSKENEDTYLIRVDPWVADEPPAIFLIPITEMKNWAFYDTKGEQYAAFLRLKKIK